MLYVTAYRKTTHPAPPAWQERSIFPGDTAAASTTPGGSLLLQDAGAFRVAFLPGAAEGYRFMFTFRWDALKDPMVWVWAMGQAFFSLSVTGSGMIVYGAIFPSLPILTAF